MTKDQKTIKHLQEVISSLRKNLGVALNEVDKLKAENEALKKKMEGDK